MQPRSRASVRGVPGSYVRAYRAGHAKEQVKVEVVDPSGTGGGDGLGHIGGPVQASQRGQLVGLE
jgi:hypothetical protein